MTIKVSTDTVTSKFLLWTPTKSSCERKWHGSYSLGCVVDQHWQSSKAQQTWYYYQRPYHQILFLQDITIPSDINVPTKEFKELPKYKDLDIELSIMWDMKTATMKHRNKGKLVWTPTKNSGRKWLGNNPLEYVDQQWQSSKPRHATKHCTLIDITISSDRNVSTK